MLNKHPEKCKTLDLSNLLNNADECLLNLNIQQVTIAIQDGRRKLFNGYSLPVIQEDKCIILSLAVQYQFIML